MATMTKGQKRVIRIIANRREFAWPRDLKELYKNYHASLRSLIRRGIVIERDSGIGSVYTLALRDK